MQIEFKRLSEINPSDIIELMNHPLVRRHMPLTSDNFSEADCEGFIAGKEQLWAEYGYGPWGFVVDGHFAGWGGFQPEEEDVDLGLVLHPTYWGIGKRIYDRMLDYGINQMGFKSITVLLPPSRTRTKGILRLGFEPDGETEINGERFMRYRLNVY